MQYTVKDTFTSVSPKQDLLVEWDNWSLGWREINVNLSQEVGRFCEFSVGVFLSVRQTIDPLEISFRTGCWIEVSCTVLYMLDCNQHCTVNGVIF